MKGRHLAFLTLINNVFSSVIVRVPVALISLVFILSGKWMRSVTGIRGEK